MKKRLAVLPVLLIAVALSACSRPAAAPAHKDMAMETPPSSGQEDADFGLRLALLEGHLVIGRELIDAHQTQNALPHFGHPVRELYGDLSPVIEARHGVQFRTDLVVLESTAGLQPDSDTFRTRFATALTRVHDARALIPAPMRASDDYTLHLVSDIATTASQEYRSAIIAGKIGSLVEYHDARGFISYATLLLKDHAASDNPKMKEAIAAIARLQVMVAALDPPTTPAATDAQFEAEAARLRDLVKTS